MDTRPYAGLAASALPCPEEHELASQVCLDISLLCCPDRQYARESELYQTVVLVMRGMDIDGMVPRQHQWARGEEATRSSSIVDSDLSRFVTRLRNVGVRVGLIHLADEFGEDNNGNICL